MSFHESNAAGPSWRILEGDCRARLAELDEGTVQTCITSPPYFGLRDYGHDGQIGLEPTPDEFVAAMVDVFRSVRRVLREDGTVWLNLGDSYTSGGRDYYADGAINGRARAHASRPGVPAGCKSKDLIGIPWMVAFALRGDGWYLRSDIIWAKPNPMPESVVDRPTKAHEYLFLLTKSPRYFYDADAIREASVQPYEPTPTDERPDWGKPNRGIDLDGNVFAGINLGDGTSRNKRSVWTVSTVPYAGAHFATFPPKLIEPCILAGTSPTACGICGAPWARTTERIDQGYDGSKYGERAVEATGGAVSGGTARSTLGSSNGKLVGQQRTTGWEPTCGHDDDTGTCTVLDPFSGSGTTGMVALRHGRGYLGCELNPEYVELSRRRIVDDAPLLNSFAEAA